MTFGYCRNCKELWRVYARAMTTYLSLLKAEKLTFGGPEWTTVSDAVTTAAGERDCIRRAIVLHEAQVHDRACPLTGANLADKDDVRSSAASSRDLRRVVQGYRLPFNAGVGDLKKK